MIISDRDVKFTLAFWKAFFECMGTPLHFSTTYHPQTDWKTKRVNQVITDTLCVYVMQ